jgi:hypothetical protein
MPAYLEETLGVIGIIRVGSECRKFPDPYEFSVCLSESGGVAVLIGAGGSSAMPQHLKTDLMNLLRERGYRSVRWQRRRSDGSLRVVEVKL